jgi:hypothetical protein
VRHNSSSHLKRYDMNHDCLSSGYLSERSRLRNEVRQRAVVVA